MKISLTSVHYPFRILLLSDTHLGYGRSLPDFLMSRFRDLQPNLILHCGDIYDPAVLSRLDEIAQVYAVRGNRDIPLWFRLPSFLDLDVNGSRIHMEHGQGNFGRYFRSKLYYMSRRLFGKTVDYTKIIKLRENYRDYKIYCFGHTHRPYVSQMNGVTLVNPGHLNLPEKNSGDPSFFLLTLNEQSFAFRYFFIRNDKVEEEKNFQPEKELHFGTGNALNII